MQALWTELRARLKICRDHQGVHEEAGVPGAALCELYLLM
jgi:hypothetical protein